MNMFQTGQPLCSKTGQLYLLLTLWMGREANLRR